MGFAHQLLHLLFLFLQVHREGTQSGAEASVFVGGNVELDFEIAVQVLEFFALLQLELRLLVGLESGLLGCDLVCCKHNVATPVVMNNLLNHLTPTSASHLLVLVVLRVHGLHWYVLQLLEGRSTRNRWVG